MQTEWDGLKVDPRCLDPRPPQMMPPNVYPEGIPFRDARPPNDLPDRLQDDTILVSVVGGIIASNGSDASLYDSYLLDSNNQDILDSNGQPLLGSPFLVPSRVGALSPQQLIETPTPLGTNWGPGTVSTPAAQVAGAPPPLPWQIVPNNPAQVIADDVTFITGPVYASSVPPPPVT